MKKILWVSPFSLHDTSSGAALQCRTMLEKLHERGIDISVLGFFVFDHPSGASRFEKLEEKLANDKQVFTLGDKGINYTYVKTVSRLEKDVTSAEQRTMFAIYCTYLKEFKPDIVMGYGGDMLSMCMRTEARRRGIPVVYTLYNGNHGQYTFPDTDLIITDSQATSDLYRVHDEINICTCGVFIHKENVVAEQREAPKYVTFINPYITKGISLFAQIALMAKKELPDVRFLVVQSRGNFAESVQTLHLAGSDKKTLTAKNFPNVDIANHMTNMKPVYAATKVLLAPSLWYESFGRVTAEAVMNGIPVLASKSGGIPEAVGEGGITIEAPEYCRKDFTCLPSEKEMRPWMDALKQLLLEDWSERCKRAAAIHDIERSTDRVLDLLDPLFARTASTNPHLFLNGSIL